MTRCCYCHKTGELIRINKSDRAHWSCFLRVDIRSEALELEFGEGTRPLLRPDLGTPMCQAQCGRPARVWNNGPGKWCSEKCRKNRWHYKPGAANGA